MISRDQLAASYVEKLRAGKASAFLGAGMSKACGFVDWKGLLREPARRLGLDIDREHDLIGIAEMVVQAEGNRTGLVQTIFKHFSDCVDGMRAHEILTSLPLKVIWTPNYDTVIEEAYRKAGLRLQVVKNDQNFALTDVKADAVLYKMHGDIGDPDRVIITRKDYEEYDVRHPTMARALSAALGSYSFLFLGFGFTDPNMLRVFGQIRLETKETPRQHYTILRKPMPGDNDYEYELTRFNLFVRDMQTYGLQCCVVESYDEITDVLEQIRTLYFRRNVFVSGSFETLEPPFDGKRLEELCYQIGAEIIRRDFNLTSGFGLGVGAPTVAGALSALYSSSQRYDVHQRLHLYPFPVDRPELHTPYRLDMLRRCGFAIFVAGNKKDQPCAEGVLEEYRIAKEQGKVVIPIGVTGYAARRIWEQERDSGAFAALGSKVEASMMKLNDETITDAEIMRAVTEVLVELAPKP